MSLFRFLKSLLSTRVNCEYFVESFEESYHRHESLYPGNDPHLYLSQAWLAFYQAKGGDIAEPFVSEAALTTTYLTACVPAPLCARALGIFMLYRERPNDIANLPHLVEEFNDLTKPVVAAMNAGTQEQLYRRYNPRMAFDPPKPSAD